MTKVWWEEEEERGEQLLPERERERERERARERDREIESGVGGGTPQSVHSSCCQLLSACKVHS